ncbi:Nramp family divalent metal transporter [Marinifilum caeruleilacunae]|uniref:Divalent metal cation transporter n=1 Tax=Marinifilum caeruleilacunae TaxID=2499076 RepID=A0ABX1WSB5_9BACT|nr:Nramp family divalent metal transporter [Marinifilum caeruleilacunae]NOU58819.1 divalent metal cation transporter [Marinifilum caeruleilacunae]
MKLKEKLKNLGPGILVTAAFIGPGTITTCTLTGAGFGYALLWGLVFSVLATIVLQEMTARLGIIGQKGLGEALRHQFRNPFLKLMAIVLVLSAILIGNAAYETGNILGASLGMIEVTGISTVDLGGGEIQIWGPVIGLIAFALLVMGSYKSLERILIALVLLMSISFISTMIIIGPDLLPILKGMFVPSLPAESVYMLIGLIGTTVVPYNLFLHASVVREKWSKKEDLSTARTDLFFSVILGGVISMSIVITSAAAFFGTGAEIKGASDLASQLKPLLGDWAGIIMSVGLFAAGISSAITAPLAAAYATAGILGWKVDLKSFKFKAVWMLILLIGIVFSAIGFSPIKAIVFAQIANGILLPVIAIYLLLIMNSKKVLGEHRNKIVQNIIGAIVVCIMIGLGIKSILHVAGVF